MTITYGTGTYGTGRGLILLTLLSIAGCASAPSRPQSHSVHQAWETPPQPAETAGSTDSRENAQRDASQNGSPSAAAPGASTPAESSAPPQPQVRPGEVFIIVNGRPITRADFTEKLIESHGLALAEQLILTIAARQRAEEMALTVTDRDVRQAHDDALRRLALPLDADPDAPLDAGALDEAKLLLDEFLQAKNISRLEWNLRMEQNAILRKIAEAEVDRLTLSEDLLRDEYEMTYGPRVQIRHIQLSSRQKVAEVRRQLAAGEDFELVARKFSENQITAARGGLMPPISRLDPAVTPLIRETAFSLNPGQVASPVHEGNWFHILKLERKFPPSNIPFENADQELLRHKLRDRLVRSRHEDLEAELFQSATVDIRHEKLRGQFERKHRQPGRR